MLHIEDGHMVGRNT